MPRRRDGGLKMVNLQPYRDILKNLGFKETDQRNLWVIDSCDLKTGKPMRAGIHLGYYDKEKKVGEPRLIIDDEERIEKDAYERCGNLSDFYYEREILLAKEKGKVEDEGEKISIKDAFGEQRATTPFNPQPTEKESERVYMTPPTEITQEQAFSALRKKIEEIKCGKALKPPEKIEIQPPQVVYSPVDKEHLLEMKKNEITKVSYQIHDLSLRIEEVKKEIEERRREDEARLSTFEYDLEKLSYKQKLINETYDRIIKELG